MTPPVLFLLVMLCTFFSIFSLFYILFKLSESVFFNLLFLKLNKYEKEQYKFLKDLYNGLFKKDGSVGYVEVTTESRGRLFQKVYKYKELYIEIHLIDKDSPDYYLNFVKRLDLYSPIYLPSWFDNAVKRRIIKIENYPLLKEIRNEGSNKEFKNLSTLIK